MVLVRFALKNPYFILVVSMASITLGVVAYLRLPKDLLPLFKTPAVQILTLYPGMPAEVVEKDITSRIERWTGQASGIERQESRSMLGVSIVRDYFRSDIDPNTALSQVTSLAMSDLYYLPPGTIPPMVMPFDPTATVPLVLLALSGDESNEFNETKLYDIAYFDLRNRLQGIPGVIAPAVYGGKLRRILTYADPAKLKRFNLSLLDIVQTLRNFNTLIPAGNMKIGDKDVQIVSNGLVAKVDEMNQFPVRSSLQGGEVLLSDVGKTEDSSQIQSNIVHVNGKRQVYLPVYRQPGANTIAVVDAIRNSIKSILARLPPGIHIDLVADQSQYVRHAITSLTFEIIQRAILAVLVIWLFLGHLQTAFVTALAIPLSLFFAFIGFLVTGDTLNAMTLGGLALVIGRLVDDSIVVTENIVRHKSLNLDEDSSLSGAAEVMMPVLAATVTTIIVFVPVFFLKGISAFLFAPLARSVALSMVASFFVAMTVIPILLKKIKIHKSESKRRFSQLFSQVEIKYKSILPKIIEKRIFLFVMCGILMGVTGILYKYVGKDLFPSQDVGHLTIKVRLPSGTRIEKTEEQVRAVASEVRAVIPSDEIQTIISNMGVLYDWPAAYTPNAGPQDAFLEIQLKESQKKSSEKYAQALRQILPKKFADSEFVIDTESIMTAALTFGLPSPINIQITDNDLHISEKLGKDLIDKIKDIKGLVDVRIQQRLDYPQITIDVNRRKAASMGLTAVDIVKNVVAATNSSVNFEPAFWIDQKNGNHYFVGTQYRERDLVDEDTLKNLSITGRQQERAVPLKELASFGNGTAPTEIEHLNIGRVLDIYANVSGRDFSGVSDEIEKVISQTISPAGYQINLRGEMSFLKESFENLGWGFILAIFLIYLVLVAQFKSLTDPFVILIAVPLGLFGVVMALLITGSTFNIQSFLGIIFMAGIVVSNSILIVQFINFKFREEKLPLEIAIVDASTTRLRPIVMTSLAAILGLLPMAIGMGRGSEPNIPLARAVIGGLLASTVLSLFVVPCLYYSFHTKSVIKRARSLIVSVFTGLIALSLLSPKSAVASDKIISLNQVIELAKKQHPLAKASRDRIAGQYSAIKSAKSGYWPRIGASAVESNGMSGSTSGLGIAALSNSSFRNGYGVSLDLEGTIYDFGRTAKKVKIEEMRLEENKGSEAMTIEKITVDAAYRYFDCQRIRREIEIFKSAEDQLKPLAKEIKVLVSTRQLSPVELALINVALSEAEANRISSEKKQELVLDRLNLAIGAGGDEKFICVEANDKNGVMQSVDKMWETAKLKRPEFKEILAKKSRLLAETDFVRAAYYPKITGLASVGQLQNTNLLPNQNYVVGIALKIPLFDGMKTSSDVDHTEWNSSAATHEAEQASNEIKSEINEARIEYDRTEKLIPLLLNQRMEAARALKLARSRYLKKSGQLSEWDQSYRAWLQGEHVYWNLQFEHDVATLVLKIVTGELSSPTF